MASAVELPQLQDVDVVFIAEEPGVQSVCEWGRRRLTKPRIAKKSKITSLHVESDGFQRVGALC